MRDSIFKFTRPQSLTSIAYAEEDLFPAFYCDPGIESGNSLAWGGKPVSLFSGAETFSRTDLSIGSVYPITIERRYASNASYDSQLGYGWALNHDKRLYSYSGGTGGFLILRKECGWKVRFNWSSVDDRYTGLNGETGALVQNADTYIYTDKSGESETYDSFYELSPNTLSTFNKRSALQSVKKEGAKIVSETVLKVISLEELFRTTINGRQVDFLSLDAEGYEYQILSGNDWKSYRPTAVIVELNQDKNGKVFYFLKKQGYMLVYCNGTNGIFADDRLANKRVISP